MNVQISILGSDPIAFEAKNVHVTKHGVKIITNYIFTPSEFVRLRLNCTIHKTIEEGIENATGYIITNIPATMVITCT